MIYIYSRWRISSRRYIIKVKNFINVYNFIKDLNCIAIIGLKKESKWIISSRWMIWLIWWISSVIISSLQMACNKTIHSISLKKFLNLSESDLWSCIKWEGWFSSRWINHGDEFDLYDEFHQGHETQ